MASAFRLARARYFANVLSLQDFARHRRNIALTCECGHYAVLPYRPVLARFERNRWSMSLEGAVWLKSAHAYFYCSRCHARGRGKVRPVRIGMG